MFNVPFTWLTRTEHDLMNENLWVKNGDDAQFVTSNYDFIHQFVSVEYKTKFKYSFHQACERFDYRLHRILFVKQNCPFDEWRYEMLKYIISKSPTLSHILVVKDLDVNLKENMLSRMFFYDNKRNLFQQQDDCFNKHVVLPSVEYKTEKINSNDNRNKKKTKHYRNNNL